MASVTFPEALGGNGQTYTDDADPNTGLDGLGYTVRFIPCLQQAVVMGLSAQSNAQACADYVQQCQTLREEVATDRQAVADDRTHVDQQKGLVDSAAQQVTTDRQAVADDRTHVDQQKGFVDSAAQQVATDRQAVSDDRTHVDQQKGLVDSAAQQVATDKQTVANNTATATQAAQDAGAAAGASIQAKNDAQALYGDLAAVDAAKSDAQQAAATASEQRGLAVTAREGAESAQEAAETAAGQSQQAAAQAVEAHENAEDPHNQYEKKTALRAGAYRGVVGAGDLFARGGILGTVSQSGGVPTGAIIERGSNANGEYVKFADGALICFSKIPAPSGAFSPDGALFSTPPVSLTFPASFVGRPVVSLGTAFGATGAWAGLGDSGTTSNGTTIRTYRTSEASVSNLNYDVLAIGRWY